MEQDHLLPKVRSLSLVDLQDAQSLHGPAGPPPHPEALSRLSRAGSQASIGHAPLTLTYPHSNPVTPQPAPHQARATVKDSQPQSAPQVRRPLHLSLSQQRSLQPLSFQNPVYHLSNPAHSSSENLSTESSHNSHSNSNDLGSQVGDKGRLASNSSLDELEECSMPRRQALLPGAATAVAVPRQSTAAGTAHIVKVEQQSRGGGGVKMPRSIPQSASLRSSSSANTEPTPTTGHAPCQPTSCSVENVAPPPRSTFKQPQQVLLHSLS